MIYTKLFTYPRTDLKTRPAIISNLIQFVRENSKLINDLDTLKEMLVFIYTDTGRAEAQEGSHDDLVMGLAIALRIIEQVSYFRDTINTIERDFFEKFEKQEVGERIIVV